jgi:hypothetical protein
MTDHEDADLHRLAGDGNPPEYRNESGDWGHLPEEPCRYCRRVGGVMFRNDDSPRGKTEPQAIRCELCGRVWEADSSSA